MKWGLGLAGLLAVAAIVLAVLYVGPPAQRSALSPEPAATPSATPPAPAVDLTPVDPLASTPAAPQAERRVATPALDPEQESSPTTLVIAGSVLDGSGAGLPDISIEACGADGAPTPEGSDTDTDETGQFRLSFDEGARPTHARFESDHYLTRVVEAPATGAWEVVLELRPVIEGTVFDLAGVPLGPPGRVRVRVRASDAPSVEEFTTHLAADGTYRFSGLPVGQLTHISARAKGFDKHEVDLDLPLAAGTLQTHDLSLARGLVVHGVVLLEETREPVPYAKVWGEGFDYEEDSVRPSTIADSEGRFRLEGFERNRMDHEGMVLNTFQIVAASETHASSPLAFFALAPEEDGEYEIELLIEQRSCAVRGVVLRSDGTTPCVGALIWGVDAQNNYTSQTTDLHGDFAFEDLPTGPFGLVIYRTSREDSGLFESLLVELELESEGATGLRLVLESSAGATLEGHVLDGHGAPVSGLEIAAKYQFHFGGLTMGLDGEVTVTDADGHYRFSDTRAGLYTLEPSGCTEPSNYELMLSRLEHRTVDFTAGACMTVEGWIELGEAPASDFEIILFDLNGEMVKDAQLASDGTFRIPDVIAGAYEVILFRHGERIDRAPVDASAPTGIVLRAP